MFWEVLLKLINKLTQLHTHFVVMAEICCIFVFLSYYKVTTLTQLKSLMQHFQILKCSSPVLLEFKLHMLAFLLKEMYLCMLLKHKGLCNSAINILKVWVHADLFALQHYGGLTKSQYFAWSKMMFKRLQFGETNFSLWSQLVTQAGLKMFDFIMEKLLSANAKQVF